MSIFNNLQKIQNSLSNDIELVAVSKTKTEKLIMEAYKEGQRKFGENKVQELIKKADHLPKDIQWHMIGHLQTNKVKYIAPFISLIHAVDSKKLIKEINKRAIENNRSIDCLLQIHIAQENNKFGLDKSQALEILERQTEFKNSRIIGLMGMATLTNQEDIIRKEFMELSDYFKTLKNNHPKLKILSMGMSNDYKIAIQEGSNMIRIGSAIFGSRQ